LKLLSDLKHALKIKEKIYHYKICCNKVISDLLYALKSVPYELLLVGIEVHLYGIYSLGLMGDLG